MRRNRKGKSPFKEKILRNLTQPEVYLSSAISKVIKGNLNQVAIAEIPDFVSIDKKSRPLIFSYATAAKIIRDHGTFSIENLIISADSWEWIIKNIHNDPDKINLIKRIPGGNRFFLIGANRVNGYFMVTYFEMGSKKGNQLKNLLGRGDTLDRSGRTPSAKADSLHVSPQTGDPAGGGFLGSGRIAQ